jgi:ammonium transporter, Amt family
MKRLIRYLILGALALAPCLWSEAFAAESAETAVAAVTAAAAETPTDEYRADYEALVAAQTKDGVDYSYAFNFFTTSMLWTVIAAGLVFLMHLGFATLESGLTQSKNTVNILFKNVFIIAAGILTYALWGFVSHYPGDGWLINGFFAFGSPIGDLNADGGATFGYGGTALAMTGYGDFIFQAMFAATAATIVSGAVAERVKLLPFLVFATLLVGLAYPWVGSWHWGGGWMGSLNGGNGFKDFAGSAVVHAFGGFAALACVLLLGPRKGKYVDGKIKPIPGHSMPLATVGVFLLFFGWFGFNGGSVLSASPGPLGLVFTTTTLAGLVGITANADIVSPLGSIVIGAIAGVIVVFSILFFDKVKIDDPVGAISVHGVCGVWGILAAALFEVVPAGAEKQFHLGGQLLGVLAVGAAAFLFSLVVFGIIKAAVGVRVGATEEDEGLDIGEHGMEAYPGFEPQPE